jgi:hypothetical protein
MGCIASLRAVVASARTHCGFSRCNIAVNSVCGGASHPVVCAVAHQVIRFPPLGGDVAGICLDVTALSVVVLCLASVVCDTLSRFASFRSEGVLLGSASLLQRCL